MIKRWLCLLYFAGLTGCAGLSELESTNTLGSSEIVLTGRIELDPPLRADEQELHMLGSGRYRNKLLVVVGDEYIDLREPGFDALRNAAVVTLGEDFHIRVPRRATLVYSGGSILMGADKRGRVDYLHLPGKVKFHTRPGDEAIYLGTIKYTRDDFNGISDVNVIDQHTQSQQAFKQAFGKSLRSRKAVLE